MTSRTPTWAVLAILAGFALMFISAAAHVGIWLAGVTA